MPTSETYKLLINENKLDEFRTLLADNPDDMDYMMYFVQTVVYTNRINFMEMLMYDFKYDLFNDNNYAISLCGQPSVNVDTLKFFMDSGMDIHYSAYKYVYFNTDNKIDSTRILTAGPDLLFFYVCANFHYEKIKLLLENGVNPNTQNGQCFTHLCNRCNNEAILLFIEYGFDVTRNDNEPLYFAMVGKCWPVVKILLENGADMEAVNKHLNETISQDNREIVNLLKEYNADTAAMLLQ